MADKEKTKKTLKNKEKVNPIGDFPGLKIDLTKFNLLSDKEQYEEIKKTLESIYKDNLKITRKHIMKVIGTTLNVSDDYIYLPNNLKVAKNKLSLDFAVVKKKGIGPGLILVAVWFLVFAIVCATYAGFRYISLLSLNKDIDDDGIADINLDIDNDQKADINIARDKENKPILNIDYKGNKKAIFNIDYDNDGKPDYNLVNDATNGKTCLVNCDIDGDGWPDVNIDLDGDGQPDMDIDTDGDGLPDLNLDLDGDRICDVNCDTDNDQIADTNIIQSQQNGSKSGPSKINGNPDTDQETASLILNFEDGQTYEVSDIMPDDQPNYDASNKPYKMFSIENVSNFDLEYSIVMNVTYNTFIGNNFKYKVEGTNGAPIIDYKIAPKVNTYIAKNIKIAKRTTQTYKITFNLEGTGTEQNYDQGKTFKGSFKLVLDPNTEA